jgi:hypothetical protein
MVMERPEESAVARDLEGYPTTTGRGLSIARRFVPEGVDPYEEVEWETRAAVRQEQ